MTLPERLDKQLHFTSIDSTNREAGRRRLEYEGLNILIVSDEQTAGRGRLNRSWESPPGQGLWCSLLLSRPEQLKVKLELLSLYTSLVIRQVIQKQTQLGLELKWPNDLMVGDKKCGGILTEINWTGNQPQSCVIGTGINLRQQKTEFSPSIRDHATSLMLEGHPVSRDVLLDEYIHAFFDNYSLLRDPVELIGRWNSVAWHMNQEVVLKNRSQVIKGFFRGSNISGQAQISVGDRIQNCSSGELRWQRD